MNMEWRKVVFFIAIIACLSPYVDPPIALIIGLVIAQTSGHPFISNNKKIISYLLKGSVIGLGFGMNFFNALEVGKEGLIMTICSITTVLIVGWLISKILKIDPKTSYLISSGTAICGGSAIAAVAPVIDASEKQMTIALGTVFILNSLALLLFPFIGLWLAMTDYQFGMWSAIAIHDTSSVVGAASKFSDEALQIATTVKLGRALWIIPLALGTAVFFRQKNSKLKIPYFIGLFILAMLVRTYLPSFEEAYTWIVFIAKKGLTLSLFFIGAGLSYETIKSVGVKPFLEGVLLWLLISIGSLFFILNWM